FAGDASRSGIEVLIALYAFAFQIFGDFAGYSSIAIGTARLLGFRLTTNFLFPYFVTNPRDFWRNWHISLSSWLRDYLYIPLGGNRGSLLYVNRNLMLTMLLGGLWHGAAWTFVLWGAYQGALLAGHRLLTKVFGDAATAPVTAPGRAWQVIRIVLMFHLTCLGWLIFRATSLEQIRSMLHSIASGLSWPAVETVYTLLQLAFHTWLLLLVQLVLMRAPDPTRIDSLSPLPRMAVLVAMIYSLLIWGNYGGGEFIYFQF
ncbi:MAG TPA: MBOAT family O-acyltransferase, partial [Gammaproteobacteria bacterium]|nr:MBOAT family O-acyltransferase [Gammaproteobacteria bacterium]